MPVKRKKDLTHQERQVKRSFEYKDLMKVEIPKRTVGEIHTQYWYVIWEKELLKPRVLKYAFRAKYFAQAYCSKNLRNYKYNILSGETLIEFGFVQAYKSLRSVSGEKNKGAFNYQFPSELSQQRKKTLRTMYRRNFRRILLKLMKHHEQN